jgi:hypothetical protein
VSPLPTALPLGQEVLLAVLRAGVTSPTAVVSLRPPDYMARLPLLHARLVPGGRDLHPRFLFVATCSVDAYATDAPAAANLAEVARRVLLAAHLAQSVHAGGVLNQAAVTQWPTELRDPDQPSGMARYHAKYAITIRRQT